MKTYMTEEEFKTYLESINGLKDAWHNDFPRYPDGIIKDVGFFQIKDGWYNLLKETIDELIYNGWDKEVFQVKQKYGSLAMYIVGDKNLQKIVQDTAKKSATICEYCSDLATYYKTQSGWMVVSCDKCAKNKNLITLPEEYLKWLKR